ncbi:8481_t:CDS:2, partial [Gigaspora margarita]
SHEKYGSIILPDKEQLNEWTVKKMFDPTVDKIIKLINKQLEQSLKLLNRHKCKAMFLVGKFSESKYLIKRDRERFQGRLSHIASPQQPITAIVKGAVKADFDICNNPLGLRTRDKIWKFDLLAF